jgi:hypothetical protein
MWAFLRECGQEQRQTFCGGRSEPCLVAEVQRSKRLIESRVGH